MYAIVDIRGKQFKVEKGVWILAPKLENKEGETVEFDQVLVYNDDKDTFVGQPYIEGAKIKGKVLGDIKDKKVIVFKYKKRKDYRKKQGHRQQYTKVMIENIQKN